MLQICEYPCENKHELHLKEREYIELLHCDLNKVIPTRTHKEYMVDNKVKIEENRKEYYNEHKIDIIAHQAECIKNRNEDEKKKSSEYFKQYNELRKDKRKLKCKEHFICECGSSVAIYDKNKHFGTQKHCQFIISQKITII